VQLRKLSELIGEPLFEPVGRSIRLTLAGEALLEAVGEISAAWQRFEGRLSDLRGLVRGRLRIAAVTTAEYFVPDLLGPFAALHPGIDIELAVENRDRVIGRLHQQVDDLAVMMLPPEDLPLRSLPFMDNPLVVIGAAQHRLAGIRRTVPLEELAGERWLMREPGSGTRLVAEKHFASRGFTPRVVMSLGSNEALKHAVGAGLGIGVISALAIGQVGPLGQAHRQSPWVHLPLEGFPILRQWSLVWRTDVPLSLPARQFVGYLEHRGKPSSVAACPVPRPQPDPSFRLVKSDDQQCLVR
jgi:DNA-binding transcriptional LysR family regulator